MIRFPVIQEEGVEIGDNLDTGYFIVLRKGCKIGNDVSIWSHCTVDPGAIIKDRVRIHNHCYIAQNTVIEEDAFLGPGVKIANDKYPPRFDSELWDTVYIRKGAKIGANVTICPGVIIGENALIGAGSVVTHNVPPNEVWVGNPARKLR